MFSRFIISLVIVAGIVVGTSPITRSAQAGGGGCREAATDGHGTNVEIKDLCFITTVLHIAPGDTVTFTNRDVMDHTVTGAGIRSGNGWGNFESIRVGQSVNQRFDKNGVYPYYCMFHPGMIGAVVVGDGSGAGAAAGVALPKGGDAAPAADATSGVTANTPGAGRATLALAAGAGASVLALAAASIALVVRAARRQGRRPMTT